MVNIFIDALTNSIQDRATGESLETLFRPAQYKDVAHLEEWEFSWSQAIKDHEVYVMTTRQAPEIIQGMVALHVEKAFVFVHLVENAPSNRGKNAIYKGVGGNLFAFACQLSLDKGCDGYVVFEAKTALITHYQHVLGAKHITKHRMYIDTPAATALVQQYFKS
jgi:hypothetical protein